MPDMKIAVDRIIKAVENKEKVIIYGDYDVDGITSITVLKKFLNSIGLDVSQIAVGAGITVEEVESIIDRNISK